MRPDNWNEKLGTVSASQVAVVTGSHVSGGGGALTPRTLLDVLKSAGDLGGYAGLPAGCNLSAADGDATGAGAQDAEGRVRTTRDHLPYLSDCSYSDTDSDSDISMDYWSYPGDIDQRPEYEVGLLDYYEEDARLSTFEQQQDTDVEQGNTPSTSRARVQRGAALPRRQRDCLDS